MVGRTPWSARVPQDPLPQALTNTSSTPTWAADQGVRPTLYSSIWDQAFSTVRTRQTRVFAARKSVPITADRATILMNIKDLLAAASFTFEGACVTGASSSPLVSRR